MRIATPFISGGGVGPTTPVAAGYISSGTFGALISTPDVGIYSFPSQVGIGIAGLAQHALLFGGTVTASGGAANVIRAATTLVAAANNDTLCVYRAVPNFTPGSFTGLAARGVVIGGFSVASYTTPGDPVLLDFGVLTGTGATNAYAIRIAPPTGATNNYLIAHTTPATFNVTAAGLITTASGLTTTGSSDVIAGRSVAFGDTGSLGTASRGKIKFPSDGVFTFLNNAESDFTRLQFGGTTASFTALARLTNPGLQVVLADGTAVGANFAMGGANATNATVGFFFINTSAGAPTGVPANIPAGTVAMQYDTTNNFLYVYNGGWKKSTVYA